MQGRPVHVRLRDDGDELGTTPVTVLFGHSHFLCVLTVPCNGITGIQIPQHVTHVLGEEHLGCDSLFGPLNQGG